MHPSLLKSALIPILLLIVLLRVDSAFAAPIPYAEDLSQLAAEAKQRQIPIMLVVTQYHCGYCERMKHEVLQPMQLSGDYNDRVLMRELMIDPGEMVTNFQGRHEPASDFIGHYKVSVTPTLLFLDAGGKEAAERILGINTVDYLLFYIEDAIDKAAKTMTSKLEPAARKRPF
jgi:thioredoxin-related protein